MNVYDLFSTPDKNIQSSSFSDLLASTPISIVDSNGELTSLASISVVSAENVDLSDIAEATPCDKKLVVIKNLPARLVNCKRLYNLLWQYGGVDKIVFDHIQGDEEPTAYIVCSSIKDAERFVINLEAGKIHGVKVNSHIIPMNEETLNKDPFELEDGSSSQRTFQDNMGCSSTDSSIPPTKTLRLLLFLVQ